MALILHIDTAVAEASVCLARDGELLGLKKNSVAAESAAWLHPAISGLLQEQALSVRQLEAVAVSAGPGSYTGLRVGLASAKGLCYALQIPLITLNTLQMMAAAVAADEPGLRGPMIDARRLEVFTGLYTDTLQEVQPAQAVVLDATSFSDVLEQTKIIFFGNGSLKFQPLVSHPNAVFKTITADATQLVTLARQAFAQKAFAPLAYSEPVYGKNFFSPPRKQ